MNTEQALAVLLAHIRPGDAFRFRTGPHPTPEEFNAKINERDAFMRVLQDAGFSCLRAHGSNNDRDRTRYYAVEITTK